MSLHKKWAAPVHWAAHCFSAYQLSLKWDKTRIWNLQKQVCKKNWLKYDCAKYSNPTRHVLKVLIPPHNKFKLSKFGLDLLNPKSIRVLLGSLTTQSYLKQHDCRSKCAIYCAEMMKSSKTKSDLEPLSSWPQINRGVPCVICNKRVKYNHHTSKDNIINVRKQCKLQSPNMTLTFDLLTPKTKRGPLRVMFNAFVN